jgi:hypothetical protein
MLASINGYSPFRRREPRFSMHRFWFYISQGAFFDFFCFEEWDGRLTTLTLDVAFSETAA